MNLTDFQTAIQAQVKLATGFDNGHVIWAKQSRKRPSRPFIELDDLDDETTNFTEDSVADAAVPTPGAEIELTSKEHVEINVQVRVFSSDVTGSNNAFNVAKKIRAFFARESTTAALVDIALVSRDTVREASLVLETEYEGRAVLTLKFRVADLETETTTFIETATVETTIDQLGGPVVHTLTITPE
jgi:hypothetical protein